MRDPSPPSNEQHAKPRFLYIQHDAEKLHEEGQQLKTTVNTLKEENLKLKTKINILEKEAAKFEKMVMERTTQPESGRESRSISDVSSFRSKHTDVNIILIGEHGDHDETAGKRTASRTEAKGG